MSWDNDLKKTEADEVTGDRWDWWSQGTGVSGRGMKLTDE